MNQTHGKALREISKNIHCSKKLICLTSELKNLCKAEDIGLEKRIKCLDDTPQKCDFTIPFGSGFYCKCPVRVYVAKNFKR